MLERRRRRRRRLALEVRQPNSAAVYSRLCSRSRDPRRERIVLIGRRVVSTVALAGRNGVCQAVKPPVVSRTCEIQLDELPATPRDRLPVFCRLIRGEATLSREIERKREKERYGREQATALTESRRISGPPFSEERRASRQVRKRSPRGLLLGRTWRLPLTAANSGNC